jgi:hypothetical protein
VSERSVATQHFRIVTSAVQKTEPDYAVASAGVYIFGVQVEVGCADAQAHDVGNRDAQTDWKSNVDRCGVQLTSAEATFVCRPLRCRRAVSCMAGSTCPPHPAVVPRTKVSRLLLRRHQPLKSIATRPAVRPEPRGSAQEATMSFGEALARHGGTGGKLRQGSD